MLFLDIVMNLFKKIDKYCNSINNIVSKITFMFLTHMFVIYISLLFATNILVYLYPIDNIDTIYVQIMEALLFVVCLYFMELILQLIIKKFKFHILFFKLDNTTLSFIYHFFLIISSFLFIILIGIKDSMFSYIFDQRILHSLNDNEILIKSTMNTMKIEYDLFFFSLQSVFVCLTYFSNNIRKELHRFDNINEH